MGGEPRGIFSSTVAANPTRLAIGLYSGVGSSVSSVDGIPFDANSLFVAVAHQGDANGDGFVNVGDFIAIANNFNRNRNRWNQGDLNGDGVANVGDFVVIANHFNRRG